MMLAKLCRSGASSASLISLLRTPVTPKPVVLRIQSVRCLRSSTHEKIGGKVRKSLWEQATAPAEGTAYGIGKGAVAGAAVIGLGSLCYYGLGLSSSPGAIDHAGLWPKHVKQRIKSTYMYLGASVASTMAVGAMCLRSSKILNVVMHQGLMSLFVTCACVWGSAILVRMIPYHENPGAKHLAWLLHTGTCGAMLAPLYAIGGPVVIRALWYTAGVVGALSMVAVCAPNEKFLHMGGPLAIGFGTVFASSIASLFLPPSTAIGSGFHAISIYGGLILFSMFLLYDTQKIIHRAETTPAYAVGRAAYDPINNALNVYTDALNIFITIFEMLMGDRRKRR